MDDISFEKLLSPASDRVIFRGIWGSYAYGTNTPESDRDTIGVFMMEQHHYLAIGDTVRQIADAVRYRSKGYDGEYEGIIPVKLWERVQSTFKANSESCHQRSGRDLKPFAGLIYCGHCNAPMFVATVTKPNGRQYRYYICHVDEKRAHRECPLHRVPAETLEQFLLNRITALLKTPTMLAKICGGELRNALDTPQAGGALENIATLWSAMFPVERYKLIHALIQRVLVSENEVRIVFRAEGIAGLLKEAGADFSVSSGSVDLECVLTVPYKLRRYAGQVKLHSADEQADGPRLPIQTALIQAHQGMEQIISGKATTMRQIAQVLNMGRSFVARTLQLANLAPDIVKAIWEKRQPVSLTPDKLCHGIPDSWEEQRKLFLGKYPRTTSVSVSPGWYGFFYLREWVC